VKAARTRDHPRRTRLPERVDHLGPIEGLLGVQDEDAGPLVADEPDVVAGRDPPPNFIGILRDLPVGPDGLLASKAHDLPALGAHGRDRMLGVGHPRRRRL
jgi:hypothetical protein